MDIHYIKAHKTKSLLRFAIPSIIAMLLETVITITDGAFVGNCVGEGALAAINLGLPILYFYLGVGLCVGVGGSVLCGKRIGTKDRASANRVLSQTLLTASVIGIAASIAFFFLFKPILISLGANGALADHFNSYYKIMLFSYPLMILSTNLGMFVRVDGKPQFCMLVGIIGAAANILLDYITVARLGMGVAGSAIATLIAQFASAALQVLYFIKRSKSIRFCRFRFDKAVFRDTIFNGSSEFIGEMANAISMFVFNYVLLKYVGEAGVAAFTVLGYSVFGYSMIAIGFGQGLSAPVSLLWGAKEKQTANDLRKITSRILICIGAASALCFLLFGGRYADLFGCSRDVTDMVSTGFRFFTVGFLLMGYNVINSMYFTGCGDAKSSALISALRGIVFLLVFAFVFPAIWGMNGVWSVTPTTELLTSAVSILLIVRHKKRIQKG